MGINTFWQATPTNEPLERLAAVSHLLNSIAIRNGFYSGYPNIHDGIAEFLNIPRRNSLLKFLDLDLESAIQSLGKFSASVVKIKKPENDGSEELINLIWLLDRLKRYQTHLTDETLDNVKGEIDKSETTIREVKESLNKPPEVKHLTRTRDLMFSLAEGNQTGEAGTEELEEISKNVKSEIGGILEYREGFNSYFNLSRGVKTYRLFLEVSNDLVEIHHNFESFQSYLNSINQSISSAITESSTLKSMFNVPIELRSLFSVVSEVLAQPSKEPRLPISFDESHHVKSEINSRWINETIFKNNSLKHLHSELRPVFALFDNLTDFFSGWNHTINSDYGGNQNSLSAQIDKMSDILMNGEHLVNLPVSDMESVVKCIRILGKPEETISNDDFDRHMKFVKKLEKTIDEVNRNVQKTVFDVPDSFLKKTMHRFDELNEIMQNATLNSTEKWEEIQALDVGFLKNVSTAFQDILNSLPPPPPPPPPESTTTTTTSTVEPSTSELWSSMKYTTTSTPRITTMYTTRDTTIDTTIWGSTTPTEIPTTPAPLSSPTNIFKKILKSTNISQVVKCIDQLPIYKFDNLILFLNKVSNISTSDPYLKRSQGLLVDIKKWQRRIRSTVDTAVDSGKSKFQGILNIQTTAENVALGVRALQTIQKILQNRESIDALVNNNEKIEGFEENRKVLKQLEDGLENYNIYCSDENNITLRNLWNCMFNNALGIPEVNFSISQDVISDLFKKNNESEYIKNLEVLSTLPMNFNQHLDRIRDASKVLSEVESTLEVVLSLEEKVKVTNNSLNKKYRGKLTSIPFQRSPWFNFFKMYSLELILVSTILALPIGFWFYEKSRVIILKKD